MKKPIHLYIFVTLSTLSTLVNRVWSAFFTDPNMMAETLADQQASMGVASKGELLSVYQTAFELQVGVFYKVFAVLLLLALVATIVLLFQKKNELASYVYIGYLFGTLIQTVVAYVTTRGIYAGFSNEALRTTYEATTLVSFIFGVVLFAIYFGLTAFFLFRKPKEAPSIAINTTDI
ncbi:TPA: MFS transporter [Streptococcus suis]|nr:MFS transporter [Streptococcus suis]MCQ8265925.1 MFS transporter [Streptococcus suis]HEL1584258.1 MFS transporter [Streptococcus suis]